MSILAIPESKISRERERKRERVIKRQRERERVYIDDESLSIFNGFLDICLSEKNQFNLFTEN